MDAFEALLTRRSVRAFTSKSVPMDLVKDLIKAAMYAPSAGNQQPWHFVVIQDRRALDEIVRVHPHAAAAAQSPVSVLICGDIRNLRHPDFWVQDCAAATQNLLLAAHAKDLGAVWVGVYPREDRMGPIKRLLALPGGIEPFALVPIGCLDQVEPHPERFDERRIHLDRW